MHPHHTQGRLVLESKLTLGGGVQAGAEVG